MSKFISKKATVSKKSKLGKNVQVWDYVQIREDVVIGDDCKIGKGTYIENHVRIGNSVKIQNYASIYGEAEIGDEVFVGPYVCFTNDKIPRAANLKGELRSEAEWKKGKITVKKGASIGAGSILITDIIIGEYALIGAGSVVTKSVASYNLVFGNPAKVKGFVCKCGNLVKRLNDPKKRTCTICKTKI